MGFIDDALLERVVERSVALPIEIILHDDALGHAAVVRRGRKGEILVWLRVVVGESGTEIERSIGERFGVGIDENLVWIEAMPAVRLEGAFRPPKVEGPWFQIVDIAVPNVSGSIPRGIEAKRRRGGFVVRMFIEAKDHACGVAGKDGEVDALRVGHSPREEWIPW